MLALKLGVTINEIGTEVYVEFLNATGVYDADDNPGGFGGPNDARNVLAIVPYFLHKKVAGNVEASLLTYNALTSESFTVNLTKGNNGVLELHAFALQIFDSGDSYVNGDIVFDNTNPSIPIIKKRVAGVWEVRLPKDLITEVTVPQVVDYSFPVPDAIDVMNQSNAIQLLLHRKFIRKECNHDDWFPLWQRFAYVESNLQIGTLAFCRQAYNEAQILIEEIFKYEPTALANE